MTRRRRALLSEEHRPKNYVRVYIYIYIEIFFNFLVGAHQESAQ